MTSKERLERAVRNERRGRVSAVVRWEKEHVVSEPPFKRKRYKTKAQRAQDKLVEDLRTLPRVKQVRSVD